MSNDESNIKKASKKSLIVVFVCVAVVLMAVIFILWGLSAYQKHQQKVNHKAPPPEIVTAEPAKKVNWQPYIEATGETESIQGVEVSAQIEGIVTKINFKSGSMVKQGDVLFEIEHSDLEAKLHKAEANVEIAKLTYDRQHKLYQNQAASEQESDETYAKYQDAIGEKELIEADISYHIIRAPFSGKIGVRQIDLGEYFHAGSAAVTLNQLTPLYVNFYITESDMAKVYLGQKVKMQSTAFPKMDFKGEVTSINPKLDKETRSLLVQATLPNNDDKHLLLPGMLTSVDLLIPQKNKVLVIPASAINYTLYGDTVFKLEKSNKKHNGKAVYIAHKIPIIVGAKRGLTVEVLSGLSEKDIVATSGQLKLNNLSKVIIDDSVKLNDDQITNTGLLSKFSKKPKALKSIKN